MDSPRARTEHTSFLLASLALCACSGGEPRVSRSTDGRTSVVTISDFTAGDGAALAALRWARTSESERQVAFTTSLDAALALADATRGETNPGLAILVAAPASPALAAAIERGDVLDAVELPSPNEAAADAAILLAHGVDLPDELFLPAEPTPGRTTLELLRSAQRPILESPRKDGRALTLGCVWTGGRDEWRRAVRTRCAESGGAVRLLERRSGDPATDAVDLLALGADALVVEGGDPTRLHAAIGAARAVGVPVVSFDPQIPRGLADCAVRLDPVRIGRLVAEAVLRQLGEGGGLVISVREPNPPSISEQVGAALLEALGVPPGQDAPR